MLFMPKRHLRSFVRPMASATFVWHRVDRGSSEKLQNMLISQAAVKRGGLLTVAYKVLRKSTVDSLDRHYTISRRRIL